MSPIFKRLYGKVEIKIPTNLKGKAIKEVRILTKNKASIEIILNADVNGSFNIMRKAKIKNINLTNGEYLNPVRIKTA